MIHVVTAHVMTPHWIPIQRAYLDRHIHEPFQVYGCIEAIDPAWGSSFDRVIEAGPGHAEKLNHMAQVIATDADADDLIMFIDGDAFPIADPMPLVHAALEQHALTAVVRHEIQGNRQPHPCFCVTTVGTWRSLPGDWCSGYQFRPGFSDIGANLLFRLEATGTPWHEIVRTNDVFVFGQSRQIDPVGVHFGVYGDIVYHHGGGFRAAAPLARTMAVSKRLKGTVPSTDEERAARQAAIAAHWRPYEELTEALMERIESDPEFWRDLRTRPDSVN